MKVNVWQKWVTCLMAILLIFEILLLAGVMLAKRSNLSYALEYEKGQLEIKSVTVCNLDGSREDFSVYNKDSLYEVSVCFVNRSSVANNYQSQIMRFEEKDSGSRINGIYEKDLNFEGVAAFDSQMIPARGTGVYRWILAVDEKEDTLVIQDMQDKIRGKGERLEIQLPQKQGQKITKNLD